MTEQDDLERLRNISIHKLLGLANAGRRVTMSCPFHNDRTPSFCLYTDSSYHCFGCGINGQNIIDFLLETGADFKEVIEELKKL